MRKALFYQTMTNNMVQCDLCSHHCRIKNHGRGICRVRENRDGRLYSLVYGRLIAETPDPIEKKPLFHFQPGSRSYSISTVGCNFRCRHCQNSHISQYPRNHQGGIAGQEHEAETVVRDAIRNNCTSISYTYVEPTIFYEFAYDCASLARDKGLKNIFVSNGYMSPEATRHLAPVLDGINIDIKAMNNDFYKKICLARRQPVLDTINLFHELGVWVEITTLLIPGLNDDPAELRELAQFIRSVDPAIPWHVTAFYPAWKLVDRPPTPPETLAMARQIGLEEGLRFVYMGNIPGSGGENTYCPACGYELITRRGFSILHLRLQGSHCPECHEPIEGAWE